MNGPITESRRHTPTSNARAADRCQLPTLAADRPLRSLPIEAGTYTPREPGRAPGHVEQPSCSGPARILQAARPRADIRGTFSGGSGPVRLPKRLLGSAANGGEIPRPSTIFTTTTPLTNADRLRMWIRRSDRQGSGDYAPPSGGAVLLAVAVGLGIAAWVCFAVFVWWQLENAEPPKVSEGCKTVWTSDARYVDTCEGDKS